MLYKNVTHAVVSLSAEVVVGAGKKKTLVEHEVSIAPGEVANLDPDLIRLLEQNDPKFKSTLEPVPG